MQAQITELQALLDQEVQLLSQVEAQMQAKKDCLIANDTTGLMRTDQALMGLGQQTAQIEQQRMDLMSRMGFTDRTLEQLADAVRASHPEPGRRLQQTRQGMHRLLESIQVLNRNNQELLSLSIQWIADTVELIARQVTPEGASYTASGRKNRSKQQGAQALSVQSTIIHNA